MPEDTILAIAAHEIAHDVLRHSKTTEELKDLTDFFGEALAVVTGSDESTEKTLQKWFANAVLPKYSRVQEFEADAIGVELLRLCGVEHPDKVMSACLETLYQKYGNIGGGFFDSHPATRERIEKVNPKSGDSAER